MTEPDFDAFIAEVRPRLARAFASAYGRERGEEALSEAMAVAWERFSEVAVMANPAGFLFRVGQSRSRSRRRIPAHQFPPPSELGIYDVEPELPNA
jgi:DNA-directed RNA polymerase specialized sigma24 family protein